MNDVVAEIIFVNVWRPEAAAVLSKRGFGISKAHNSENTNKTTLCTITVAELEESY